MKKLFVSLMLLLCVSLPCFADDIVTFFSPDRSIMYEMDTGSVNTLPNGNTVLEYQEIFNRNDDRAKHTTTYQIVINENNKTYAVLQYWKYGIDNQLENKYQNNVTATDFGPIPSAGPVHMVYDWLVNNP